jgi:hypothetical protein
MEWNVILDGNSLGLPHELGSLLLRHAPWKPRFTSKPID